MNGFWNRKGTKKKNLNPFSSELGEEIKTYRGVQRSVERWVNYGSTSNTPGPWLRRLLTKNDQYEGNLHRSRSERLTNISETNQEIYHEFTDDVTDNLRCSYMEHDIAVYEDMERKGETIFQYFDEDFKKLTTEKVSGINRDCRRHLWDIIREKGV